MLALWEIQDLKQVRVLSAALFCSVCRDWNTGEAWPGQGPGNQLNPRLLLLAEALDLPSSLEMKTAIPS